MFMLVRRHSKTLMTRLAGVRADIDALHQDAARKEEATKTALTTLAEELAAQTAVKNAVATLVTKTD
jgi:hypothetical protein